MKKITIVMISFIFIILLSSTACSKENTELILIQETEHGLFYSPSSGEDEKEMVKILAESFELNYPRITNMFQYEDNNKVVIHVYADKEEFVEMIGRETEGTYVSKENIIKVYTPIHLIGGIQEEYTFQLIHEFVHAVIQQINPSVAGLKWLDEGIAEYASKQLEEDIKSRSTFNDYPTLRQLESGSVYFDEAGSTAYLYSGILIKYIVDEYGIDALNKIIRTPTNIEVIMKASTENIYEQWVKYLEDKKWLR
ncbi:hypothetical protein V1503_05015 [Bacillus sp. SCS-151]|uniref:hypothetical protein n=1 Tax=Nanhaiella sioensis TaxID=3115293 RepID=UPI00397AAF2D